MMRPWKASLKKWLLNWKLRGNQGKMEERRANSQQGKRVAWRWEGEWASRTVKDNHIMARLNTNLRCNQRGGRDQTLWGGPGAGVAANRESNGSHYRVLLRRDQIYVSCRLCWLEGRVETGKGSFQGKSLPRHLPCFWLVQLDHGLLYSGNTEKEHGFLACLVLGFWGEKLWVKFILRHVESEVPIRYLWSYWIGRWVFRPRTQGKSLMWR